MLQCVRTGEVFCGLYVAHVHIICPVRDVTHVRKCTRPSPAFRTASDGKLGGGLGTRLQHSGKKSDGVLGGPENEPRPVFRLGNEANC